MTSSRSRNSHPALLTFIATTPVSPATQPLGEQFSSLSINTPYTFRFILRTTAGSFPSYIVTTRSHTIEGSRGVSVCFDTVDDPTLLEEAKYALKEMGAKWSKRIEMETTHFVCTTPAAILAAREAYEGRGPTRLANEPGVEYQ